MNDSQEIKVLLEKILEVQQAHFAAYREQSQRAISTQDFAVTQQSKAIRMQRMALAAVVAALVIMLLFVVANMGP